MNLFISTVYAQSAEAANQPSPMASMVPFIFIFLIFYFLMIKPQKKRLQEEQALIDGLNRGDEVYTKAGILGTITGITEKIVTLEVSEGVKMKVLKSQVGGLSQKIFETKKEEKK